MHAIIGTVFVLLGGIFRKNKAANLFLKKALNDLKLYPGRSMLVIFALTIGLWGVGSILVSYTVLHNDLNRNFLQTSPAQIIMKSTDFNKLDLKKLATEPQIESAEFRDLAIYRIEALPGKWLPLMIYGVEDFNHFQLARFYPEKGKKIPDPGTILIERDAQNPRVSNLHIGTDAHVRIGSKNKIVPITGIVFDPAQAPATQDAFVYSYTDKKTYGELTGEKMNQRLIIRLKNAQSKDEVKQFAEILRGKLHNQGIELSSLDVPKFNEHPHQFQLNTLLMTNGIIGFLAFLTGAVLVSQLMGSILSRQVRQIGILKAIGASRRQILKIYLAMVFVPGAISSLIAIPLAVFTGYQYAGFVAKIINFNILTTALPHSVYIGLIMAGLLLPVLFSLSTLLKAVRISVYDALVDYGLSAKKNLAKSFPKEKSRGGLLSLLRLSNAGKLALRNTLRRKNRLMVTIATMALGVAIFNTGFNVRQSLADFLADNRKAMKYDVQVVFKESIGIDKALQPFKNLKLSDRVELWNGGKGRLQTEISSTMSHVGVIALPYNTRLMTWDVIYGRWLKPSKDIEVVLNQRAVDAFGFSGVDHLPESLVIGIKGKMFKVKPVGIVKEFDVAKIYIDKDRYDSLVNPGHLVNSLMFVSRKKGYDDVIAFKKEIENTIYHSDLNVLYVMSQAERAKIIYDHLNIILSILLFLALLVLFVSALGMASAVSINIMERTREIGVLRAIGAANKKIFRLFITEGFIISFISIVAGMLMAWPLSVLAAKYFGNLILGARTPLNFSFSYSGFLITLALTVSFGWLAGRLPAKNAMRVSTQKALSYE